MGILVGPLGTILATDVRLAATRRERMAGLLRRPPLGPRAALVLPGAAQVHTFGMNYPIDVAFCDADGTILHLVHRMQRRRLSRWVFGARFAIETAGGGLADLRRGDRLSLRDL